MASVNFMKCHGAGEAKAMIRHSDTRQRKAHEHSNPDIDKTRTDENVDLGNRYEQAIARYAERIRDLDESTNRNHRHDRVTMFALELAAPEGMNVDESKQFFADVYRLMKEHYGVENVIAGYAHYDELHSYIDHGEVKESRPHMHAFVVPEIDGQLDGKHFSARARMIELNRAIDELSRERYQTPFLTHGEARKRTVEQLKAISNDEAAKRDRERVRTLGEIKRGEELQKERAGKTIFGKPKQTITIPYEEYMNLERTARAVKDVFAEREKVAAEQQKAAEERAAAERMSAEVKPWHDIAEYDRRTARQEREKAERLVAEREREISERAYEVAAQMVADREREIFGKEGSSREERLEDFCAGIHYKDGTTVLERFEAAEREREERFMERDDDEWER